MDYDDDDLNKDVSDPVRPVLPISRVERIRKDIAVRDAAAMEMESLRMKAWERQRRLQLGRKWGANFKAELVQRAVTDADESMAGVGLPYALSTRRRGSGFVLVLPRRGTQETVAVSSELGFNESAGRIDSLIGEFLEKNGIRIEKKEE